MNIYLTVNPFTFLCMKYIIYYKVNDNKMNIYELYRQCHEF